MKKSPNLFTDLLFSLAAALILGAGMAAFQPPPYYIAFISTCFLFWLSFFLGIRAWRFFKGDRRLAVLLIVTFFLRVILGVFLHQSLPQLGFDTEVQNAGYVYSDAYERDQEAFSLVSGGQPLLQSGIRRSGSDQYGGLLLLSAALYRLFSMDVARPLLITILGAFCMTAGLAFLYSALRGHWNAKLALMAAWFYALYPEGVLLGSSQMREPFIIGLFCLGLWAVLTYHENPKLRLTWFMLAMLGAVAFSIPAGLAITVVLVMLAIVQRLLSGLPRQQAVMHWAVLGALTVLVAIAGWMWIKPTLYYDAYLTETSSGLISMLLKQVGETWRIPFVGIYGLAQPVLPAAITDNSMPIWMAIATWRGIGWYFVIPFLVYTLLIVWKVQPGAQKWLIVFLLGVFLTWVVVSSLRAGGDQWDNPRYRAIFLPVLSMLFGWSLTRQQTKPGVWFWVIQAMVWIDVILFTLWYLPRRGLWGISMPFFSIALTVALVSLGILLIGLVINLVNRKRIKQS